MNRISILGITAGIISAVLLFIPISFINYFTEHVIINRSDDSQQYLHENGIWQVIGYINSAPQVFTLSMISMFIAVGIPGYIAARYAKRNYILHSLIIGMIYMTIPFMLDNKPITSDLDMFFFLLILPISFTAGYICSKHMKDL